MHKNISKKFLKHMQFYLIQVNVQLYDQHGHEGVDGRYSTEDIFRGAGGNFNDIFNDLFSGQGRRRGGGI